MTKKKNNSGLLLLLGIGLLAFTAGSRKVSHSCLGNECNDPDGLTDADIRIMGQKLIDEWWETGGSTAAIEKFIKLLNGGHKTIFIQLFTDEQFAIFNK